MGLLWIPVPLFPVMCGYVRGPLSFFSEKGNLFIMSFMSAAVTSLTINLMYATIIRYASIDQLKIYALLTTRESAYFVVAFMLFCFLFAFFLNFMAGVSSDELMESAKVKYPELVPIFRTENVFGFDFIIPMVFGVFPIMSTIILVVVRNDNMTVLGEVVFCMGNVHTILFNLSTTLIIRPYRRVTFLWIRRIYWITVKRQTLSVTISSEAVSAKTQIATRSRAPPPSQFTPVF
uniref:Serpentine Receptor, class H n=1 Tax=Panagrellus redivivus TaxID=6233 RepID=A0A7E4W5P0_PANRE